MAWFSDLAGKAENLLNKIDQNTAAVLSKDKNDEVLQDHLLDVTWENSSPHHLSSSDGRSSSTNSLQTFINKEDELNSCINSVMNSPAKHLTSNSILNSLSTRSSLSLEHSIDNKDVISEYSTHSSRSSPDFPHTLVVNVPEDNCFPEPENSLLYTDIKQDQMVIEEFKNRVLVENNFEQSELETMSQMNYFTDLTNDNICKTLKAPNSFPEQKLSLPKFNDNHNEIEILKEKLQSQEVEITQYVKEISSLQLVLERNRVDLQSTRQELERHRARALKTLQEKDKLIAELKNSNLLVVTDGTNMELDQLKQECASLRQENQELCQQLRTAQEELVNADLKIEEVNKKITITNKETYGIISSEKKKRVEAEEDARTHLEKTRILKEELAMQHENLSAKLRKQENEISRLKSQLSAISTPSSAVESRLSTLTQTLVSKQNELEVMTSERNALRLQLEKREHEYRRLVGTSKKSHYNDTDDTKPQVPTFLMETPFDTGVTRRVKRAYSTLDTISIRIGVFLRRYPLARIFVIIYITFLQFWVLVVLFFQSHSLM